ncbi:MAG: hypothetical protein M3384_03275 [Acidobacteriota bacterium]|nr:hypothetical protein [Acidobacteriota bacterium]
MYKLLSVLFIFSFCIAVSAQKKLSDREREGFTGKVKLVKSDTKNDLLSAAEKSNTEQKCKYCSEHYYDRDGNLTQIINVGLNFKVAKNIIDGVETYKFSYIVEPPKYNGFYSIMVLPERPIEEPENLSPPDNRYDQKYVYEYDSLGRIKISRAFKNDGILFRKSTYTYDDKDRIVEEVYETRFDKSRIIFKYDQKGNLIERNTNTQSGIGEKDRRSKNNYSDYKFDSQGNWIERKETFTYEDLEKPVIFETLEVRTIVYY